MSKPKNSKRVLSIVLVIALSVGVITISGSGRAKANSSTPVIAEDFETAEEWINNSDPSNPTEVGAQKVSTAQVPNYITEQHFEEAAEYNGRWRNQSPGRGTMDYVEDGENHVLKYTSASAETATFDFNNGDNQIFEKGKTYTLSYKYKSTVSFHAYHAGLSSAWDMYRAWVSPSDTWTTVTQQITPNDSLGSFQIGFQILGQGEFYLDDFVITCGTKDKVTEMVHSVLDLDFEEEAELDCFKEGAAAGTLTTEEKKDGARSFKMTTSSSWTFVVFGTFPLEKGKEYTISYDWKVPAITGGDAQFAYSRVVNRDKGLYADQGAVLKQSDILQTPTEWAKVTYTYTPTEDIANAAFVMELGGVGNIYIDNLSVSYTTTGTETTYSEGIGNCGGAEPDNVLVMENMTEVTHAAAITAGTTYEYSFDMKNDATGSDFAFGFGAGDNEIWNAASGEQAASGWTTISGKYTAASDADSIKFTRAGAGKVYLDNISLYEVATSALPIEITVANAWPDSHDSWYIESADITKATAQYYYMTILADGKSCKVAVEKSDGKFVIWNNFFSIFDASQAVPAESFVVPAETVLYPIDPVNSGWNTEIDADRLQITNNVEVCKVGSGWGTFSSIHDTSTTPIYYNIDNGTSYEVTSSANAYEIKKGTERITTKTLDTVGTYDIIRIEKDTKFVQKVVLYKNGDVNESNDVDIKDVVALKKLASNMGTEGLAGTYAADMNRSGNIDDTDVRALRYAIVNADTVKNADGKNTYNIQVTKGESLLNGVMPIVGFDGPNYDTDRTGNEDFITAEIYDMVKDLGINTVVANFNQIGTDYVKASRQLRLAEERGIKVYLNDAYVSDETNPDGIVLSRNENRLSEITAQYDGYASFTGYYIYDEPMYNAKYNNQKSLVDITAPLGAFEKYTNINSYLNLFPYICGPLNGQLGGSSSDRMSYDNYKLYVKKASSLGAQALAYDMYLRGNGVTSGWWFTQTTKYKIHTEDFYTNLNWMRTIASEEGKPFQAFVQVGTDFQSENESSTNQKNLTTVQEMYLEANAALAMGAKGIQYYSLIQPSAFAKNSDGTCDYYRSGLINAKGEANNGAGGADYEYYNAAKKINTYIAKVDEVLMNASSKAVIATDSTTQGYLAGANVTSWGSVSSVRGTKALVGCFDYYGKEAYFVVNTTPDVGGSGSAQTILLNFNGAKKGSYIAMGNDSWTDMTSTTQLSLRVPAGESVLVVLD